MRRRDAGCAASGRQRGPPSCYFRCWASRGLPVSSASTNPRSSSSTSSPGSTHSRWEFLFFLQKYCWKLSCQVRKENSCTEESQTAFVTVGDKCLGIIFVQVQYKGRVYQAARKSKIMGCIPSPRVFESSDCASRINSVLSWSQNLNENPHPVCLPCGLRFPHETAT